METLSFRPSVPNSVVVLAHHLISSQFADNSFFECCKHLQTPEMDKIWRLLLESKPIEGSEAFLMKVFWPEMEIYGLGEMSIAEKACAAVFYHCIKAHRDFGSAKFLEEREMKIDRYIIANDVLRELIDDRSANDARFEPGLCESLEASAALIIQRFRELLLDFDPAAVKKNGKSASLRSALRSIGFITINIFGEAKYEAISIIGNVVFGHEHGLTGQTIKTWFKDLRPPSEMNEP